MNSQLIDQLASQRITEIREEVAGYRMATAAREPRESIKERAGWALIHTGLKLTGPPARPRPAGPRPVGL
jgi:hypothetical protein